MSEQVEPIRGGCRCGAVRYAIRGFPYKVSYCHCESCRKATGAPVVVMVLFRGAEVGFTQGEPRRYESSPGVMRGFCVTCGTPLTWEGEWDGSRIFEVHASTLDEPARFPPTRHAFVRHRLPWFHINDGLPQYEGASPPQ